MMAMRVPRECAAGYSEGVLRAYLDGELDDAQSEALQGHAQRCGACHERLMRLRLDGALVLNRLRLLDGDAARATRVAGARPPAGLVLARARAAAAAGWRARLAGSLAALREALAAAWRPAPLAAGAVAGGVLLVGAALTQPAVQSFAQGLVQSLRVQKVQPVKVDPAALHAMPLPSLETVLQAGTYTGPSQPSIRTATVAEAARATGLALRGPTRLPSSVKGGPQVWLSEPISFSFTYDGEKLVQLARELGASDPALLAQLRALHGVTVRGAVPAAAFLLYGEPWPAGGPATPPSGAGATGSSRAAGATRGTAGGAAAGPFLGMIQLKSPSLDVPKDVNVDLLREQLLRSGVVPPAVAAQLLAIQDWKSTLVVPVTRGTTRQVPVDGVSATLIVGEGPYPVLLWQRDGALYLMATSGSEQELLEAARSLAPVR